MASKAYVVAMTVSELKEELKQRGLSAKGTKKDLRDRLEQALYDEELDDPSSGSESGGEGVHSYIDLGGGGFNFEVPPESFIAEEDIVPDVEEVECEPMIVSVELSNKDKLEVCPRASATTKMEVGVEGRSMGDRSLSPMVAPMIVEIDMNANRQGQPRADASENRPAREPALEKSKVASKGANQVGSLPLTVQIQSRLSAETALPSSAKSALPSSAVSIGIGGIEQHAEPAGNGGGAEGISCDQMGGGEVIHVTQDHLASQTEILVANITLEQTVPDVGGASGDTGKQRMGRVNGDGGKQKEKDERDNDVEGKQEEYKERKGRADGGKGGQEEMDCGRTQVKADVQQPNQGEESICNDVGTGAGLVLPEEQNESANQNIENKEHLKPDIQVEPVQLDATSNSQQHHGEAKPMEGTKQQDAEPMPQNDQVKLDERGDQVKPGQRDDELMQQNDQVIPKQQDEEQIKQNERQDDEPMQQNEQLDGVSMQQNDQVTSERRDDEPMQKNEQYEEESFQRNEQQAAEPMQQNDQVMPERQDNEQMQEEVLDEATDVEHKQARTPVDEPLQLSSIVSVDGKYDETDGSEVNSATEANLSAVKQQPLSTTAVEIATTEQTSTCHDLEREVSPLQSFPQSESQNVTNRPTEKESLQSIHKLLQPQEVSERLTELEGSHQPTPQQQLQAQEISEQPTELEMSPQPILQPTLQPSSPHSESTGPDKPIVITTISGTADFHSPRHSPAPHPSGGQLFLPEEDSFPLNSALLIQSPAPSLDDTSSMRVEPPSPHSESSTVDMISFTEVTPMDGQATPMELEEPDISPTKPEASTESDLNLPCKDVPGKDEPVGSEISSEISSLPPPTDDDDANEEETVKKKTGVEEELSPDKSQESETNTGTRNQVENGSSLRSFPEQDKVNPTRNTSQTDPDDSHTHTESKLVLGVQEETLVGGEAVPTPNQDNKELVKDYLTTEEAKQPVRTLEEAGSLESKEETFQTVDTSSPLQPQDTQDNPPLQDTPSIQHTDLKEQAVDSTVAEVSGDSPVERVEVSGPALDSGQIEVDLLVHAEAEDLSVFSSEAAEADQLRALSSTGHRMGGSNRHSSKTSGSLGGVGGQRTSQSSHGNSPGSSHRTTPPPSSSMRETKRQREDKQEVHIDPLSIKRRRISSNAISAGSAACSNGGGGAETRKRRWGTGRQRSNSGSTATPISTDVLNDVIPPDLGELDAVVPLELDVEDDTSGHMTKDPIKTAAVEGVDAMEMEVKGEPGTDLPTQQSSGRSVSPPVTLTAVDREWEEAERVREVRRKEAERARQELETRRRIEARLRAKQEAEGKARRESSENARRRTPSPPRHPPTNLVYVDHLTRPFTKGQLFGLLTEDGPIVQELFWTNRVKSHCIALYQTLEAAIATRKRLHGTKWPSTNPKRLAVDFLTAEGALKLTEGELVVGNELMQKDGKLADVPSEEVKKEVKNKGGEMETGVKEEIKQVDTKDNKEGVGVDLSPPKQQLHDHQTKERESNQTGGGGEGVEPEATTPTVKSPPQKEATKLLDELFRKTKTTPCIYWLPLTEAEVAERVAKEAARVAEREKRRQERMQELEEQRKVRQREYRQHQEQLDVERERRAKARLRRTRSYSRSRSRSRDRGRR